MQREREKYEKHTGGNSRKKQRRSEVSILLGVELGRKLSAWFFLVTVLLPLGEVSLTVQWDWTEASAGFGGDQLVV